MLSSLFGTVSEMILTVIDWVLTFLLTVFATVMDVLLGIFDADFSLNLGSMYSYWSSGLGQGMKLVDFMVNVQAARNMFGAWVSFVFLCLAFRLGTWAYVKVWGST